MKTNEKGITLVSLVITVVILAILTTVATNSGKSIMDLASYERFKNNLKVIQTKVNELNETNSEEDNIELGQALTPTQSNFISKTANNEVSKIIYTENLTENEKQDIQNNFRLFTQSKIENQLGLSGIEGEFLINIKYRYVIYDEGFIYNGETYYMADQIETDIYNVQYHNKNASSGSYNVVSTQEGDKWKIQISDIQYNGNISNWTVKYKLDTDSYWETTNDLTFYVTDTGEYTFDVVHGDEVDLGIQHLVISIE